MGLMNASDSPAAIRRPEEEVVVRLRSGGPALVALSGGVDSSLVAAFAVQALGSTAVAVTLSGPAVAQAEVERARKVAAFLGIAHEVLPVDPLAREEYRTNPTNRCFFCRTVETAVLRSYGDCRGVLQFLDGIHLDDLSDDRPGLKAMDNAGFVHPLLWAGWTKADVRRAARQRALPNYDQPSEACLASRVAHGQPISREVLAQVEAAEAFVQARGFRRVRVRVHGNSARVEVDPDEVARLITEPVAREVRSALRALGFDAVALDLEGYGHGRLRASSVP